MEDLRNRSVNQLFSDAKIIKSKHDNIKEEIIGLSIEIDRLTNLINEKMITLENTELEYIKLIEEIDGR